MDHFNLIDLSKEVCESGNKLISPLIPAPSIVDKNLSDVEDNPFDKVLRTVSNENDPFECVSENTSVINNKIKNNNLNDFQNKANEGYLISPIQTPTRLKKHKKLTSSPLYLDTNCTHDKTNNYLASLFVPKSQNSSLDGNLSNVSLQILNDSVFNMSEINLNDSYQIALNLPLPTSDSSDDNILNADSSIKTEIFQDFDIPSVVVNDEVITKKTACENSNFNNAFIDHSSVLSTNTPTSFNTASLGKSEISSIFPSTSSNNSGDIKTFNPLNEAFLIDSVNIEKVENKARKCMSARKVKSNSKNVASFQNLNNSFAGFNRNNKIVNPYNFADKHDNESIFLEGSYLAQSFRSVPPIDFEDEVIITCTPPWLEDKIIFVESDEENAEREIQQCHTERVPDIAKQLEDTQINNDIGKELKTSDTIISEKDDSDVQNAKDLLQNLSKILNRSGDVVNQRTLGENLLNSLALALNIDNQNISNIDKENNSFKIQRSKSDSRVNEKFRPSTNLLVKKVNVPKLKSQPITSVKLDKNLKSKTEKEKMTTRGPLKALIPLANVTKARNNAASKSLNSNLTPPKNPQYQLTKTSTPNDTKLKSPIAQSTPDVFYKKSSNASPISKRPFGFYLSPFARTASTNDISNISLNKSISPKQNTSSTSNINKSLHKSESLTKLSSNSSIPTTRRNSVTEINSSIPKITRRNSVTEINSLRNSVNKSCVNNKPSILKRSSSFQSKILVSSTNATSTVSQNTIDNNNTVKKYGLPGKIKPLKLVPKMKKTVGK